LFAFYPGFAISVERFLSEPLGGLLVLLSLLILAHKRIAWAGIVLALAVLARETALLAALATAGIWLLQTVLRFKTDRWRAPGPLYWLPPVVVYLCWQAWLHSAGLGSTVSVAGRGNLLGWPMTGITASASDLLVRISADGVYFLLMMAATLAWAAVVATVFRRADGPYRWIWLAYLALASLLGTAIWNNSPGFLRITTELNLLGMLVYLLVAKVPHRLVVLAWLGCWSLTAGAEAYRLHLIDQARFDAGPLTAPGLSHGPEKENDRLNKAVAAKATRRLRYTSVQWFSSPVPQPFLMRPQPWPRPLKAPGSVP
jgi:hypothetical protein